MAKRPFSSESDHAAAASSSVGNKKTRIKRRSDPNQENAWNDIFQKLVQYKNEYGHCLVPEIFNDDPNKLSLWVMNQRALYKLNKLSGHRKAKLDSIGFVWGTVTTMDYFDSMCDRLVLYKNKHGHCNVPRGYKKDPKLGNWVYTQRRFKRKKQLSPESFEKLDAIGFIWILSPSFEEMCGRLSTYKESHRHCIVPIDHKKDLLLAGWVNTQRKLKKMGILSLQHIKKLDSMGFEWVDESGAASAEPIPNDKNGATVTMATTVTSVEKKETVGLFDTETKLPDGVGKPTLPKKKHALPVIAIDNVRPLSSCSIRKNDPLRRVKIKYAPATTMTETKVAASAVAAPATKTTTAASAPFNYGEHTNKPESGAKKETLESNNNKK